MHCRRLNWLAGLAVAVGMAMSANAAELTIGTQFEPSIDPHFLYVNPNMAYSDHIYGWLAKDDENGMQIPDLAVSWTPLDDTTWEIKLRQGVKFHDGTSFTAEDVVFSFDRIPNVPNNPSPYTGTLKTIASVDIVDPYTIHIKTDVPNPLLITQFPGIAIVSKKATEGRSTADFNSGKAAIGTGPYKFVEYVPGDRLVLERNDEYWGGRPFWDKVTFRIIADDAARVAALLGGDVDLIDFVPPADVPRLRNDPEISVHEGPSNYVIYVRGVGWNDIPPYVTDKQGNPLDHNPFRDVRVLRAISKAIDRKAIISKVMDGMAVETTQMLPPGSPSYNPDIPFTKYDPDGARALLAEAGYPDGFGLTIHCTNDRYVNDTKLCQTIGQMLARVGLDMKVEALPKSVFFDNITPPEMGYSFFMAGWGDKLPSALWDIMHSYNPEMKLGVYNESNYSNPEFDRLVQEGRRTFDPEKRRELFQKAMALGIEEHAIIPIHGQIVIFASRKGLTYQTRIDEFTRAMDARPAN